MQQYLSKLIVGGSLKERTNQLKELSKGNKFQITSFDCNEKKTIADVRGLVGKVSFKPSIEKKYLLNIIEIQKLSTEAQSTLLKLVEEPEGGLSINITADTQGSVLATILSRCQLVDLGPSNDIDVQKNEDFFQQPLVKKLAKIDQIELDDIIFYLKNKLDSSTSNRSKQDIAELIEEVFNLKNKMRTTNLNKKLAKENLILKIHNLV